MLEGLCRTLRKWPAGVPGEEGVGHVHTLLTPPPRPCMPAPHPSAAKHTSLRQGDAHTVWRALSGSLPPSQAASEGGERVV